MTDDDYNDTVWELLEMTDRGFTDWEIKFLDEMSTRGVYTDAEREKIDEIYYRGSYSK